MCLDEILGEEVCDVLDLATRRQAPQAQRRGVHGDARRPDVGASAGAAVGAGAASAPRRVGEVLVALLKTRPEDLNVTAADLLLLLLVHCPLCELGRGEDHEGLPGQPPVRAPGHGHLGSVHAVLLEEGLHVHHVALEGHAPQPHHAAGARDPCGQGLRRLAPAVGLQEVVHRLRGVLQRVPVARPHGVAVALPLLAARRAAPLDGLDLKHKLLLVPGGRGLAVLGRLHVAVVVALLEAGPKEFDVAAQDLLLLLLFQGKLGELGGPEDDKRLPGLAAVWPAAKEHGVVFDIVG
mmetsp:Transcript_27258/g.81217  ORF Transcript_27258/g.81217 Transcript_27258/m.81217 type:complete len:294 (-) Transcript_27258:611-1492(-)